MTEIKRQQLYRPQQVSQGFRPSQAPDVTPLLRQNQQRMQNEQQMFKQAMQQDFATEQKILEFNQKLESRDAEQLSQFSSSLFNTLVKAKQAQNENERAEGTALFYESLEAVQQAEATHDAARAQIDAQSSIDSDAAAIAFQKGAPYEVVRTLRSLSGHGQAAFAEQMAINMGSLYEEYQKEQLSNNESIIEIAGNKVTVNKPNNMAEFSGVRAFTRKEFIKQVGIHNLTPGLQAKAFKNMYEVDAKLDAQWQKTYDITRGANDRQTYLEEVKDGVITMDQFFTKMHTTPGVNGDGNFTFPEIHKILIEELAVLSIKNPERAQQLIEAYGNLELNGQKFSKIHDDKILKFKTLSEQYRNGEYQRTETEAKRQLKDFVVNAQKLAVENPNFTMKDQEDLIRKYKLKAARLGQPAIIPRELMEIWSNFSAGAQQIDRIMEIQENRKRAFALDPDEIRRLPQQVQDKYLKDAELQAKARLGDLKPFDTSIKELVSKNPYVVGLKGLEGGDVTPLIISDFKKRLRDDVISGLKDNPNADPAQLARDSLNAIRGEFTAGVQDPDSEYYIGGEESAQAFPKYFGEETPQDVISKQLGFAKKAEFLVNRVAREGITVLDDKLLIADSLAELKQQRKNYIRTGQLPQSAVIVARTFNWDPFEVFNRQLKGNKLDAIETFRDVQAKATDTFNALKMVMRGEGNQQMVRRITSGGYLPVRSSIEPLVPQKGGVIGLTPEDYRLLAFVISAEAERGTDDEYGVAAVAIARLADPRFPNTLREVIYQENQFEAVQKGLAYDDPELQQHLMSKEGNLKLAAAMRRGAGMTQFRGLSQRHNMGPGDLLYSTNGNFYFYEGQTVGSGPYKGVIPRHYEKYLAK